MSCRNMTFVSSFLYPFLSPLYFVSIFSSSSLFAFICFLPNFILSLVHSYYNFSPLFYFFHFFFISFLRFLNSFLFPFFTCFPLSVVNYLYCSFLHYSFHNLFAVRNLFIPFPCSLFINLFLHPPRRIAFPIIHLSLRL